LYCVNYLFLYAYMLVVTVVRMYQRKNEGEMKEMVKKKERKSFELEKGEEVTTTGMIKKSFDEFT